MRGAAGEARRWRAGEARPRMRAWEWYVDRCIGGRRPHPRHVGFTVQGVSAKNYGADPLSPAAPAAT
jgi:hypothetical protein